MFFETMYKAKLRGELTINRHEMMHGLAKSLYGKHPAYLYPAEEKRLLSHPKYQWAEMMDELNLVYEEGLLHRFGYWLSTWRRSKEIDSLIAFKKSGGDNRSSEEIIVSALVKDLVMQSVGVQNADFWNMIEDYNGS